ncbi:hypothetical protein HPB51_023375 [Rhipicephalus microplus]|uniref:Tick transposon n=1 Tax=Rhipicephalus microplus TaxID=6941 RepID=A0A9J6DJQ6_RHIMP|nr:hypothetical protein HPB51_023375 [Rhipicephalus microplus]
MLLASGISFSFTYPYDGMPVTWKLLGLVYADNLVLLAESPTDLQQLLSGSHPNADINLPGGDQIQWATEYRYLGVVLSTCVDLLGAHEINLRKASQRAANALRRKSLWGCNRFLLIRDLWKGVHFLGLTFANAILCLTVTTRKWLERDQREVGRMALGCHRRVAIEAIQGDLGWSSFHVQEARSRTTCEKRLQLMDDERWPTQLFRYANLTGIQTQWCRRLGSLKRKFGFSAKLVIEDKIYKWAYAVKTQVWEEETEQWRRAIEDKSTLLTYCTHKADIGIGPLYDNSGGSALLFEARARALRTLAYRRRFDTSADVALSIWRICSTEEETAEHIVFRCADLCPGHPDGTTFPLALGFRGD